MAARKKRETRAGDDEQLDAAEDRPTSREPVRRYAVAQEPPVRRAGGYVLTERGWVLDR